MSISISENQRQELINYCINNPSLSVQEASLKLFGEAIDINDTHLKQLSEIIANKKIEFGKGVNLAKQIPVQKSDYYSPLFHINKKVAQEFTIKEISNSIDAATNIVDSQLTMK